MVGGIKDLEVESSDEDEEDEDDEVEKDMHVSKQKSGKSGTMFSIFK